MRKKESVGTRPTIKVQILAITEDVLTAFDPLGAELLGMILSLQLILDQALLF